MTESATAHRDAPPPDESYRFVSMDQCRGFIILGMLFGNFMAHLSFMPWILRHQRWGEPAPLPAALIYVAYASILYAVAVFPNRPYILFRC